MKDFNLDAAYKAIETGQALYELAVRLGRQRPHEDRIHKFTWRLIHD